MTVGAALATLAFAYLVGAIPVAVLVGRRHALDPRVTGDRNPGYWNMQAQLGVRAAVPVFVGDVAKGAIAVAPAFILFGTWVGFGAVAAAMIGHAWPVYTRFRGGRSILVFVGGVLVVTPIVALLAIAVCVVVALATRSFAYGARAGVFSYPVIALVVDGWVVAACGFACMAIIGIRFLQAALAARRAVQS